jgi:hypothetical protein
VQRAEHAGCWATKAHAAITADAAASLSAGVSVKKAGDLRLLQAGGTSFSSRRQRPQRVAVSVPAYIQTRRSNT